MSNSSAKIDKESLIGFQAHHSFLPWIDVKPSRHTITVNRHELLKMGERFGLGRRVPNESGEISLERLLMWCVQGIGDILVMILGKEFREGLEDWANNVKTIDC